MTNPYQCEDCTTPWPSLKAANECAILDAAETRQARRPVRSVMRPASYWEDD